MFKFIIRLPRTLSLSTLASLLLSTAVVAGPGDQIGDTVNVVKMVTGNYDDQIRQLNVGDRVKQNELIEVRNDGRGELKLDDNTKLAIGPNSKLKLDKFIYDSEKNAGDIAVNLTKGAFRFVTGKAEKPSYVIKTPSASIAVRGTIFDVYILPDKSTWLLLHEGAVEVRGAGKGKCRVLDQPGRLIPISSDGTVGKPVDWKKIDEANLPGFDAAFPFVADPPSIDNAPVLTRAAILDEERADNPEQACRKLAAPIKPPRKINRAEPRVIKAIAPKPVFVPKPRKVVEKSQPKPKKVVEKEKPKSVADTPRRVKPIRVAKRPRPRNSDDGWGNGVRAMDIVIGIGIGGGFGKSRGPRPGGDYGGYRGAR